MGFCMYCGRKIAEGETCNCQNNNMAGQQISMGMSSVGNMQQTATSYGICKKCGAPLQPEDKFCDVCGTPAEERRNVQQPKQPMPMQGMPVQQVNQQPRQPMPMQGMPVQQVNLQPKQPMPMQGMPVQQVNQQPRQPMSAQGMPVQQVSQRPVQQITTQEQNVPKKKKKKGKGIALLLVCVLLVAGIGAGAFYFIGGQNTCEKTVTAFFEGKLSGDLDKMLETLPEEANTKLSGDATFNAMKNSMAAANQVGTALLGDNYKYSYDITSQKTLSKEDIDEVIQKYKDADMELKSEISEAKEVSVAVKASLGGADMNIGTYTIKCLKMNGKWYIDYFSAL